MSTSEKIIKDSSVARGLLKIDCENNRIDINEDELDLFSYFDKSLIPDWQPPSNIKPYSELKKIFFDIETDGGLMADNKGVVRNNNNNVLEALDKFFYNHQHENQIETIQIARQAFFSIWFREPTENDGYIVRQINKYFRLKNKNDCVISDIDLMCLDYGLDAHNHSIALIGFVGGTNKNFIIINCRSQKVSKKEVLNLLSKNEEFKEEYLDKVHVFNCHNEKSGLEKFIGMLEKAQPEVLSGFNCFTFDLPFIIKRCEVNLVSHPFYIKFKDKSGIPHKTIHKSAQRYGSPQRYHGIFYNYGFKSDKECLIIDLYNQVLGWDFVSRKLTKYSLKQSVIQTGLRKTQRTELNFSEMMECLEKGDLDLLSEYLFFDLEDTMMLGDFLIPSIYYQKLFLPTWKLQSISHSGNGSKWNDILKRIFPKVSKEIIEYFESIGFEIGDDNLPKSEQKFSFEGGLTGANKGVYLNVSKIDVGSLYPSIMLTYGIQSIKDFGYNQLAVLKYLLEWRLRLKEKKKNGTATNEEIRTEAAFKVIINSCYGALATMGINFNDYKAAALVTAYGRKILKLMVSTIIKNGGEIVSIDTDGVYYSTNDSTFKLNESIHEKCQEAMPRGINLDYELEAKMFFVPPIEEKKFQKMVLNSEEFSEGIINDGLKKNYIIIGWKNPKDKLNSPLIVKSKGRFVKRERCKFEKDYQLNLMMKLATLNDIDAVKNWHQENIEALEKGLWDIGDLKYTRKIRKGEKIMTKYGESGDVITYYRGIDTTTFHKKTGKPNKKKIENWVLDGDVGYEFYISVANKLAGEVFDNLTEARK